MFDSTREINRAATTWDAKVFSVLLNSEDSWGLKIEDVDATAGCVYLSVAGPRYTGEGASSRLTYCWMASDDSIKREEKGKIMQKIVEVYQKDVPERRSRVRRAGEVIGYPVFL